MKEKKILNLIGAHRGAEEVISQIQPEALARYERIRIIDPIPYRASKLALRIEEKARDLKLEIVSVEKKGEDLPELAQKGNHLAILTDSLKSLSSIVTLPNLCLYEILGRQDGVSSGVVGFQGLKREGDDKTGKNVVELFNTLQKFSPPQSSQAIKINPLADAELTILRKRVSSFSARRLELMEKDELYPSYFFPSPFRTGVPLFIIFQAGKLAQKELEDMALDAIPTGIESSATAIIGDNRVDIFVVDVDSNKRLIRFHYIFGPPPPVPEKPVEQTENKFTEQRKRIRTYLAPVAFTD